MSLDNIPPTNDHGPYQPESPENRENSTAHTVSIISYVLLLVVAITAVIPVFHLSVILLLVAFILDLVAFSSSRGTWLQDHFRWRLRSTILAMILYIVTFPLIIFFILPMLIAWCFISLWFLYRIIIGLISFNNKRKPEGFFQ